jgi:hypothetical protein
MNWYAQRYAQRYAPKIYLTNSNYIEDHAEIITTARFHKKMEAAYLYYEDNYNCSISYGVEFKNPDKGLLFC